MKHKTSRVFKCFKCFVVSYLVFNCVLGISTTVFASYLLIFRYDNRISLAKDIVLCFVILPANLTLLSTILGWSSIKRRRINLLKISAVLLALTDILQIIGCLWCFTSLPQINENVSVYMEKKFLTRASDPYSEHWWSDIQTKLKCCGIYGPSDYSSTKAVPFSCCGSDTEDITKGFCSFLWQKGCSSALAREISSDLTLLGVVGLCVAFLQMPGVFIIWCFAKRISKETISNMTKSSLQGESFQ